MSHLAGIAKLLFPFKFATLDDEASTIYGLTGELRICYVNRAWTAFARANGASWADDARWGVGANWMDAMPSALRPAYERLFHRARNEQIVVDHEYECSSPTTLRRYQMRIHPCASGAFLVVNALVAASPLVRAASEPVENLYRDTRGIITQCCHCRCVRSASGQPQYEWNWVPDFVTRPPANTSHGLCGLCFSYYYPEDDDV